jgi:hypothetical protein
MSLEKFRIIADAGLRYVSSGLITPLTTNEVMDRSPETMSLRFAQVEISRDYESKLWEQVKLAARIGIGRDSYPSYISTLKQ